MKLHHEPILKDRVVEGWALPTASRLVDGTVGRAGHSLHLLGERSDVELLCLDRDPDAVEAATRRLDGFGARVRVEHSSYADLSTLRKAWGDGRTVDGVLLDLGVSSPQIDDPERGFSTRFDGPLDLRFDRTSGESAADWIRRVESEELVQVLREFGEVPNASRVARAILAARQTQAIESTADLRDVVAPHSARGREPSAKSVARVFQAIRIRVNGELDELDRFLTSLPELLAIGGRVAILSFHSLEDRRVKRAFQAAARDCVCPPELPACNCGGGQAWLRLVTKRPIVAEEDEVRANPRARSAKLRVAERIARASEMNS